ncbi:MAG TPA: TPM domain-containing protein [Pyrinomonadaceae bacterium]|nr:TPM domain-containing protein [Pyrinomonadaceae bacterium]
MRPKIRFRDRKLQLTLVLLAATLFFVAVEQNPSAQTRPKFPAPVSRVNDLAGALDEETKQRLENILENLKQRKKIEFYLALVEGTAGRDIFDFSRQLAHDWDIGARTTIKKSLLLVMSVNEKVAFTQFSRSVQSELPDGVLGEMSQRMRAPLAAGRISDAVNSGVGHFVGALAQKSGLTLQDFEQPANIAAAAKTPEPKTISDAAASTPVPDSTPESAPVSDINPAASEISADIKALTRNRRATSPVAKPGGRKVTSPEEDEAELEEVNLTLTLPFEPRVTKLKEFLDTHPRSKARPLAEELLISAYAALGDQKLKGGDLAGGVELLFLAIDQAPTDISDKLFSGVISQIPLNLYLRGDRAAAFKAAKNIETKFGDNARHLLALAGFFLTLEDGDEAHRVAAQAVKLAPEMAEAYHTLGLALHISFRLDEATAAYKRALELDPRSKGTRRILADLKRAAGRPEEALSLYREQLTVESEDKAARSGLVIALFEAGKKEEATAELETTLKEDPKNLALLTGAAYWFLARGDTEKGFDLSRRAVEVEPRYTWAQIAAARALVARKQPLEAERALRFARQYGKFPTLDYELANVLAAAGLYEEAAETLRQSFVLKNGKIETHLAGRRLARASDFLELLAPERHAGIFQASAADTASNAAMLRALLALHSALNETEQKDETTIVTAAREFASGDDEMRAYRQIYAASRLLQKNVGLATVYELAQSARSGVERALAIGAVEVAVQADEFRDMRARVLAAGGTPYVAEAPRNVLLNILLGRIEDISGWALFNQDKTAEAIDHLRRATNVLPEATPAWRSALWHLGAAFEQADQKEEALNSYIKSYVSGDADPIRRQLIEQLYRKMHGSLDGLEQRMTSSLSSSATSSASPEATSLSSGSVPAPTVKETAGAPQPSPAAIEILPEVAPTPSPAGVPSPKVEKNAEAPTTTEASKTTTPEPTPSPSPSPVVQDSGTDERSLAEAAARIRANVKITGRVKDANNNGISNVVVILISPRGTVLVSTTDHQGNFSFNVSPSQRNYRLVPSKEGYQFDPVDRAIIAFSEDLKEIDFVGTSRAP